MQRFEIERNRTNVDALDTAIRDSIGDAFLGLSTKPGMVMLFFSDDATGTQMQAARNLALLHDPDVLSPRQAREANRRQAIADARQLFSSDLDLDQFDGEPTQIQELAERIAWLEQEIRDLRGL